MNEQVRWTAAVRALALLSVVLLAIVGLEARTVQRARAELQQLRTECGQAPIKK